ncbi:MAG: ECF transporter S component [Ruminococcus sp.]|nr:ECF transporter S component [Ruminococcus sp.]
MAKTSNERIKSLCSMAMLTAIAIVADILIRIPNIGGFLTYEPKDVVLTIGGFIFGPVAGILMALVVCLIEMVTISTTGIIGFVMNFLASGVFIGVASVIYFKKKNLSRAIIGLVASTLSLIVVMLLWNYIMTPIFFGMPREAVLDMFLPLLIPFNAIKGALNSALTLLLYKGVVTALRKSGLVPKRESADNENFKTNTIILIIVSAFIVATLILVLLIFAGII